MASVKRKGSSLPLQRRVRPRVEAESDLEDFGSANEDSHAVDSESEGAGQISDSERDGSESDASDSDESSPDVVPTIDTSKVSFGALAKAQEAMPTTQRRRRFSNVSSGRSGSEDGGEGSRRIASSSTNGTKDRERHARSSKHAPVEMSSKKRVSRRRDIVEVHKLQPRDPRFAPPGVGGTRAASTTADEAKARRAYAFLEEYRDNEIRQLKAAIKTTTAKTPEAAAQREELKRRLMAMEERKRAQERKDRALAVLQEHRRQEKELVKQGKKPFYLKRSEQKKRLLLDQYAGMSQKQIDKAIERKRKKEAAKEKKSLPFFRRRTEA
ncbi:hypothetical protein VTK73DRAFT_8140 [Phialemonium thermophilum]|uniref:rRNA biogenesis protein RRP36 n=1 Tax=Phialemonium thermophilum TaxID=223376 RepID=A0ABR3XR91_9PEZI